MEEIVFTRYEAADYLRISIRTLDKMLKDGRIKHFKINKRGDKKVLKKDLIAFVDSVST